MESKLTFPSSAARFLNDENRVFGFVPVLLLAAATLAAQEPFRLQEATIEQIQAALKSRGVTCRSQLLQPFAQSLGFLEWQRHWSGGEFRRASGGGDTVVLAGSVQGWSETIHTSSKPL